jgi:hypothetical protein
MTFWRMNIPALLIMSLCLLLQTPTHAARTFFWTFETDRPEVFPAGTDSTPTYSDSTVRETFPFAYSGQYCLEVANGTYNSATFDNPTANHIWASPAEGTIRVKFRFLGTTSFMLFQITGKDRSGLDDTNDGIQFRYNGGSDWSIRCYWTGTATTTVRLTAPADTGTWHTAQIRWRSSQAPYFSASIDTIQTLSNATVGAVDCAAWHHLLIGNDLPSDPEGLWFDDFEVSNEWINDSPTGITGVDPARPAITVSATPNPMRDRIEFTLPAGDAARSLTICDRAGRIIVETPWHGVSTAWANAHAPAGLYFYTVQTEQGEYHGSFIKLK